ncbi:hypothetical protein TBLA_0E03690 [Henningerozyma blattae CBS 6284]|uniref:Uncharacterized protein n=1 Tax=Henningerozyma blattae (strain ATCC 34711 / CBS 6284 / DSM 70876 / NBRC 10599 / NRRL Y-10934 / UCD 77-7) TaxID=1071380 RepID=I2H4X1_HENB6|nr:hypothetical protein TBLA_0E03690 [Tetrapisispora blattae CBS 6284]CCH61423.1 hypothetical protein TBLA_0E03690 [Tetrapisispora blattae CBS 6284]
MEWKSLEPSEEVLSWEKIKNLIASGNLPQLRRNKASTTKYHQFKDELKKQKLSVSEHVMKKLGWDMEELIELNTVKYKDTNSKIEHAFSQDKLFQVTENDFPYNFDKHVVHLLVWSKIKLPLYEDESLNLKNPAMNDKINEFLARSLQMDKCKYDWFLNYTALQSIENVSHIHLLIYYDDLKDFDLEKVQAGFAIRK